MENNKERALNLLIETYKLYAGFSAIIIAGLLSYSSGNIAIAHDNLLYASIFVLCLSSMFCIFGIQYFISRVNKGIYDIYSGWARFLTILIMISLFLGLVFSFLYIYNYKNAEKTEMKNGSVSTINVIDIKLDNSTLELKMNNQKNCSQQRI